MGLRVGLDGFGEENTVLPVAHSLYRLRYSGPRERQYHIRIILKKKLREKLDSGIPSGSCRLPVSRLQTENQNVHNCNFTELNQNSALLTLPRTYPFRIPAAIRAILSEVFFFFVVFFSPGKSCHATTAISTFPKRGSAFGIAARLRTDWSGVGITVRDRNFSFTKRPDRLWVPSFLMGTFPGGEVAGA